MALIQSATKAAGAVTTTTLAFPSAVGAGHTKFAFIWGGGTGNTTAASDNLDGSYAQDNALLAAGITGSINSKLNATAGSTTVTCTQTVSSQLKINIGERDDIATSAALDQIQSNSIPSTTNWVGSATGTTTQPNEIAVAVAFLNTGPNTPTAGSGWTLDPNAANQVYPEYQLIASPATVTGTMTQSANRSGPLLVATYLGAGPLSLTANTGSFTLTGEAATLTSSTGAFSLSIGTGTFSLQGQQAGLNFVANVVLIAAPGSFDLVGGLETSDLVMDAVADVNAQFALFGPPVTLTGPAGTAFALSVSAGAFALSGPATVLTLSQQFTLIASSGVYALTGETLNGLLAGGICNTIPQPGIVIVLEIITEAYQKIGVVSELEFPTAEQGANALRILNDYLLNQAADGMRLGWFKQTDLSAVAPLRSEDVWGVKLLLARQLASHYGITLSDPVLLANIADAERMLTKRSIQYFESDLSELSRPEGGPWGGPGQWW